MNKDLNIMWFKDIGLKDLPLIGGKNANLGEMTNQLRHSGVRVPPGYAISAQAYKEFLFLNRLDKLIAQELSAYKKGSQGLEATGQTIRNFILQGHFSAEQCDAIEKAYQQLCEMTGCPSQEVVVRSSATAEDLPEASFAGQQESYPNISGTAALLNACKHCFASLYTDRAIAYREEQGFEHQRVALSIGVQQMVRSDRAGSGVMFTLDTETGFPDVILINAAWGLGDTLVKGRVNPDRYMVFKPFLEDTSLCPILEKHCGSKKEKMIYRARSRTNTLDTTETVFTTHNEQACLVLSDNEILQLARWAHAIEKHYARPMDIEWAKDGNDGLLYIVQARPETVISRRDPSKFTHYKLNETSRVLVEGHSVGSAIVTGQLCYVDRPEHSDRFPDHAILVTERTDPDWVPLMRRAAGVITDAGGTTSHAAIVSRELNVAAVVGTGNGTQVLKSGSEATLSCAEGAVGKIYEGKLSYLSEDINVDDIPSTRTAIMINAAIPDAALKWWQLPVSGIGLTRIEFMISSEIKVHPMALVYPEKITDSEVKGKIDTLTKRYSDPKRYFIESLAQGIAKIAASRFPQPVIVRLSDFKTNEYRGLLGGEFFEQEEANPMIGFRGASRYCSMRYKAGFELECLALKHVRERMGFRNVVIMIPFCRTLKEADDVLRLLAEQGLARGKDELEIFMMCEIPSNVILAEKFAQRFDGFSIGSNDLTQLILGVDRESTELQSLFDARDEAVKRMIEHVIKIARENNCKVGICGQAPSDYPDFAEFLVGCGIDSISLNPDSVVQVARSIEKIEKSTPPKGKTRHKEFSTEGV